MNSRTRKILVVADDPALLNKLVILLDKWGFDVISSKDGAEAWKYYQGDPEIHIIICDWIIPKIESMEFCRLVRNLKDRRYTYIIMLAGDSQIDEVISGLKIDVDDLIARSYNPHELQMRIGVGERLVDLEKQLVNKIDELSTTCREMHSDLEMAATTQRGMLPPPSGEFPGIIYSSSYIPCEEIGGDLFNLLELGDSRLGIYIFDVAGHGVHAAIQSVAMGSMLSSYNSRGCILTKKPSPDEAIVFAQPREVVNRLNTHFQSASSKGDFITFLYGILDPQAGTFTYTRAGHPAPVHVSQGEIKKIPDKGDIPIGIIPEYNYEEISLSMEPGDRLYLFTDGIPEAPNGQGIRFGVEQMLKVLSEASNVSLDDSITNLIQAVGNWQGKESRDDDMTLLGIEMNS